jgi:hypothetical protein
MSQWLPLHKAIFKMVVRKIPNPKIGQKVRINEICKKFKKAKGNKALFQKLQIFKNGIENCDPEGPVMAFVSKMNPIYYKNINEKDPSKKKNFVNKFQSFEILQRLRKGNGFLRIHKDIFRHNKERRND